MCKHFRVSMIVMVALTGLASPTFAEETAIPITPPGGTDLNQASNPPPGLYGALLALPLNGDSQLLGYDGKPVPASKNVKISIPIVAAAFEYVYPLEIAGGTFRTVVTIPFQFLNYNIGGTVRGSSYGLGDIFSDVLVYSRYMGLAGASPSKDPNQKNGLLLAGGLSAKIPVGIYDVTQPLSSGGNLWVTIPNFAATYTTNPFLSLGDATELSARFFFGVPYKNSLTGYTSGNIADVDFSAAQRFGNFTIGLAGAYETQVSNDTYRGGVPVPVGGKFSLLELGPVLQYNFTNGIALKAKYQTAVIAKNFVDGQFFVLTLSSKIF